MSEGHKITTYSLLPTQMEFLFGADIDKVRNTKGGHRDISLYQGGFGSGKTFSGSLKGLLYALKWAGCKGLVGAKTEDLLNSTTKQKYLEHMANIGLKEGVHWWYEDRKSIIKFMNESTIKFKTLSDWENLMSFEFTWIEIEEASFIEEIVFKKLIGRLRSMIKPEWEDYHYSMFLHTNPQGRRGWIYKYFINPKTKIDSYRAVIASTRENYHLGEEYVGTLMDLYSADEIEEMIEGLDVENDNSVAFPYFSESNTRDKIEFNPKLDLILACDFNYNPMCWYLMQYDKVNDTWYVLDELIYQNTTTKNMCDTILPEVSKYGVKKLTIMGDSHGRDKKTGGSDYGTMAAFFTQKGYETIILVQKANPLIKERLSILRSYICNGNRERKIFIAKSCEKLNYNFNECMLDLSTGKIKEPTDRQIQDDIQKKFLVHPIDAVSYPIYFNRTLLDRQC